MPLNDKQKAWLESHLGVEKGIFAKATKLKRTHDYTSFYDEKARLEKLAEQFEAYDFAINRSKRLQKEIGSAEDEMKRLGERDLEKALKESRSELSQLESRTNTDLKNCEKLEECMGVVRGNIKLIMESPVEHAELAEYRGVLISAIKTAKNSDFAQALEDLNAIKKPSSALAKLASTETTEKNNWEKVKTDTKTCIEILKVMPHADATALEKILASAQKEADQNNFKTASESLKDYKKTYEAASKAAHVKQQTDIDNLAKADLVNSRLDAIDLLLVQVAVLPGLTAWIADKENALKEIRPKFTDTGEYAAAWKVLDKEWVIKDLQKTAEKESAAQSKNALKNESIMKLHSNIQKDLEALKDLATDDVLAEYSKSLASGMDIYITVTNDKKASKDKAKVEAAELQSKKAMTELNSDIDSDLRKLGSIKKACEDLRAPIENGLKMLLAVVSTEARGRVGLEWERLSAALAVKEYGNSQPKLEKLLAQINELLEKNTRDNQGWEKQLGKLGDKISADIKMVKDCPVTSAQAGELQAEWAGLKRLGERKEPGEALAGLPGLTDLIDVQLKLVKQYDSLKKTRDSADTEIAAELEKAKGEIDKLKAVVAKARSKDEAGPIAFEDDHARITNIWKGNKDGALDPKDLQVDKIKNEIKELIAAVKAAASDTAAIGEIAGAQEGDENRLVYLGKAEAIRAEIEKLAEMDSRSSIKFEKELAAIDKDGSKDYAKAITDADKLLKKVGDEIVRFENVHKQSLDSVKLMAEATRNKVKEAEKRLGKKKDGFKDFFSNLESLIDELEKSLMASTSVAALMTANHEFNEILRPMAEIEEDAGKGGKDKLDYGSVIKTAEAQSKYLNSDSDLESCQPSLKKMLLEKFKGIQTSIKAQSPREATKTLEAFEKELDEARTVVSSSRAKRNTFKLNAKTAKAKMKKLDPKLEYSRTLEGKLKGLEAVIKTENKEDTATRDLVLLLVEVDRALNDPKFAIEQDAAIRRAEIETEQKRQEWEAKLEAFGSVMAEVNSVMKKAGDDADLTQLRELESMRKECKKIAKGGDYVTALKKLELTQKHATRVMKNPVGEKVTSRNSLPQDLKRYQDGVKGFNTHMSDLSKYIATEGQGLIEAAPLKKVTEMLSSMRTEFDIKVFDKAVELLSNKKADTNAKRAAREEVLSTVRSYQTRLDKGPLMLNVLLAPFDKLDPRPAFNGVRIALNSLDVNVRRCV